MKLWKDTMCKCYIHWKYCHLPSLLLSLTKFQVLSTFTLNALLENLGELEIDL